MPATVPFSKPVEDSVPKIDNAIAVGEDLDFQRRWWRFERVLWTFFLFIILCDLAGLFGRGYLAKAERRTPDHAIDLTYERIERAGTPSTMSFHFASNAVQDGHIQIFVSQSIVKSLGAQRISPQPASSVIGEGGVTYTFPASNANALVEFALEPQSSGVHHFAVGRPGSDLIQASIVVLP